MYVYIGIYLLCMIKITVRWCTSSMKNVITLGKLIGLLLLLLFCLSLLLLLSILFLKTPTSKLMYKFFSSNELARLATGTIFLYKLYYRFVHE